MEHVSNKNTLYTGVSLRLTLVSHPLVRMEALVKTWLEISFAHARLVLTVTIVKRTSTSASEWNVSTAFVKILWTTSNVSALQATKAFIVK